VVVDGASASRRGVLASGGAEGPAIGPRGGLLSDGCTTCATGGCNGTMSVAEGSGFGVGALFTVQECERKLDK